MGLIFTRGKRLTSPPLPQAAFQDREKSPEFEEI
jgi:hypothetical protein